MLIQYTIPTLLQFKLFWLEKMIMFSNISQNYFKGLNILLNIIGNTNTIKIKSVYKNS
jgi:hypothetical protein